MIAWVLAIAGIAGFIAGHLDENTSAMLSCGAFGVFFTMKALAGQYVAQLFDGPTIRPPAPTAAEAETLAAEADEVSRTRRVGNLRSKAGSGKERAS